MDKYRLVQEHKATETDDGSSSNSPKIPQVRITQQGKPRNYISYAMGLFSEGTQSIVLKAMGRAISKAVTIAEILKRKNSLHQINVISSVEMMDVYEPVEEGLDTVTNKRYVSCLKVTLSKSPLDGSHIGYQPPLPLEEMHPQQQQQSGNNNNNPGGGGNYHQQSLIPSQG